MNHSKTNLTMTLSFFLLMISLPGIKTLLTASHTIETSEKRQLDKMPKMPSSWASLQNYPKTFDDYYKDHFGYRPEWLNLYRTIKYWINDPVKDKVIFGQEPGWLFFNDKDTDDVIGDYRNINQFSDKDLEQFIQQLKDKQAWLTKQNIHYLFVLAPSKHYVYPEYLPTKYQPINQKNLKQQLSKALQSHPEIRYLDLTQSIIEGKSEQQMFLKSDTHWTDYATNIAQFQIMTAIEKHTPNHVKANKKPWSNFVNESLHVGDLAHMNGTTQFQDIRLLPDFLTCAETPLTKKTSFNQTFDTDCKKPLRALVFRDSFFSNLQPFISEYLGLSRYVWQEMTYLTAQKHIKAIKPHIVIEEWVDRHLPKLRPPKK